jgi:hypothetical protein
MIRAIFAMLALGLVGCGTAIGDDCRNDEDCEDVGYCSHFGICTKKCGANSGSTCPEGAACVAYGQRQICLAQCEDNGDCNADETCVSGACQIAEPLARPSR